MKIKGILTLASVAILVATGVGNAFAYTWPGTDWSKIDEGNVWWYDTVDGIPQVQGGSYLT